MATIRVSIRWQQSNTRTGGWSENFWINKPSIGDAKQAADGLVMALTTMKGGQVFCPRFRISIYGGNRQAQTFLTGNAPGRTVLSQFDADYPTTRYQLKLTGSVPQFTNQWIGGILDRDVTGGGFYTPAGSSVGWFQAVQTILRTAANGWSLYVLDPAINPVVVAAVDATTGQVTTATAHGLVTNDIVRTSRIHGIDGINGVWRISLVDTTKFLLLGWKSSTQTMTRSPNAKVRKQSRVLQQISNAEIVQVTSHRVGRPTGLLGGRRTRPSISLAGPLAAK